MNLVIRSYKPEDEEALIDLWHACKLVVPQNDPRKDISRKLRHSPEMLLVAFVGPELAAAVMVGYEGHRGAINYLAVSPDHQGKGVGRRMMEEAESRLRTLGCAKINLNVRTSNLGVIRFYERLGFRVDDVACLGKRLEVDSADA